jgi:hypothetical protein
VKTKGDKVFVVKDDKAFDPVTGAETPLPADAEDVINNNLMRSEIDNALAALKLFSKDEKQRAATRSRPWAKDPTKRAAADRKGLCGRDSARAQGPARTGARGHPAGQQRQGQAAGGRASAAGRQQEPRHQDRC